MVGMFASKAQGNNAQGTMSVESQIRQAFRYAREFLKYVDDQDVVRHYMNYLLDDVKMEKSSAIYELMAIRDVLESEEGPGMASYAYEKFVLTLQEAVRVSDKQVYLKASNAYEKYMSTNDVTQPVSDLRVA